jgi:fructose/tagatose bisphosphate aldolase
MAIDWSKVDDAYDLSARAKAVQKKIEECTQLGHVRVDDNADLAIPFTNAVRNFYLNQAQSLFDQALAKLQEARGV